MSYWSTWKRRREKKYQILYKRGPSTLALIFAGMALALWSIFAILSSYPIGLYIYYSVMPKTSELLAQSLQKSSQEMVKDAQAANNPEIPEPDTTTQISRDLSLPEGHYLSIPKIGVDTIIWEGASDDYESVLR